ncbi:MAG: hypothetical protein MJ117_00280 [Lachnospiraceae bacterium]|nr:hypothetical protein [Lachnospiraceae bacterium]
MARLIIGDGQTRNAQHDANIFAKIFGSGTLIASGEMRATKPDNNTIRIGSGMAICEGRVFENEIYDDFSIPTGEDGAQTTYYLGYRIYQESVGDRIEKYISTSNHEQGSLAGGDSEMYAMLYSVTTEGINLGDPVALCEELPDIINGLSKPDVKKTTVVVSDKKATSYEKINLHLEKKNGVITLTAHDVFNFLEKNKSIDLSGTIPAEYRPENSVSIACVLTNNANVTGHVLFTITASGVLNYVSSAVGWNRARFSATWMSKEDES